MRGLHGNVPGGGGALLLPLNDLDTQPHGPVILRSLAEPAGAASSAGRPQRGRCRARLRPLLAVRNCADSAACPPRFNTLCCIALSK